MTHPTLQECLEWLQKQLDVQSQLPVQQAEPWISRHHEITEKLKAIRAQLEAGTARQWQTIETAPKNGTRIWASFNYPKEAIYPIRWCYNFYERAENWTLDDAESATLTYDAPTHWMPLPEPP